MYLLTPKKLLQDVNISFINTCSYRDIEAVRKMFACMSNINTVYENTNALISASSFGRLDVVEFLLQNGADPNIFNSKGYTALHCIVYLHSNGQKKDVYIEIAKLLIKYGAIVDLANFEGDKPIDISKETTMNDILTNNIF